jgi:hypothetical protein
MTEIIANLGILIVAVFIGVTVDLKRTQAPSYAFIKPSNRNKTPLG